MIHVTEENAEFIARLIAPFDEKEVKWKPQAVKNNQCLAVAYIDVRVIQDRLDQVVGIAGWEDAYKVLPNGSVMCRLRIKLGKKWVSKMDVGSPSEQPDEGDRTKAAVSDSLKRVAVKFGIARYLYRLPLQWCDYDPVKKKIINPPKLTGNQVTPTKSNQQPIPSKETEKSSPSPNTTTTPEPAKMCELEQRNTIVGQIGDLRPEYTMNKVLDSYMIQSLEQLTYNQAVKLIAKFDQLISQKKQKATK